MICMLSEYQLNYTSRKTSLFVLQCFRVNDNNQSALCGERRGRGTCAEGGTDWHTAVHAAGDGTHAKRGHDAGADTGRPCPAATGRHTDGTHGLCGYQRHAKHNRAVSATDSRGDNHPSDTVYKTGEWADL